MFEDHSEDRLVWKDNIKMDLRKVVCGLDSSGAETTVARAVLTLLLHNRRGNTAPGERLLACQMDLAR